MTSQPGDEHELETVRRPRSGASAVDPAYAAENEPAVEAAYASADEPGPDTAPVAPARVAPQQQLAPLPAPGRPRRSRLFSDLDLNADVPSRAVPAIGEWGPGDTPSTREKVRLRWFVPVLFVVICVVLGFTWRYFWTMLG